MNVVYSARSPDYQEENAEEQKEEHMDKNIVDFMVLVDNQKGKQVVFELFTIEGEITVNNVFPTERGEEYKKNKILSYSTTEYTGPIFESLDENL